jgi:hypothetical protein
MDSSSVSSAIKAAGKKLQEIQQESWRAILPFNGHLCISSEDVPPPGDAVYSRACDLFDKGHPPESIVRFDPGKYPPPVDGENGYEKGNVGYQLITDLQSASADFGGGVLTSNGGGNKKKRKIQCQRRRTAKRKTRTPLADIANTTAPQLRGSKFHADRQLNRSGGKSMAKMTTTFLPSCKEEACKVYLWVEHDNSTYFVRSKTLHAVHTGHPHKEKEDIPVPMRRINDKAKESLKSDAVYHHKLGPSIKRIEDQYGQRLSRRQVKYCQKLADLCFSLEDTAELESLVSTQEMSTYDKVEFLLRKQHARIIMLKHGSREELPKKAREVGVGIATSAAHVIYTEVSAGSDNITIEETEEADQSASDDLKKYAELSRASVNADDNQDVLLALVWVLPHSKKLFESYFEVLFIDGTHKTNNEDRPLLTIAAKDGYGNVHVILRAFIPNEQRWLFRWLFQTAVPSLLGRQVCDKVKLIVTDGDAQEIDQLNKALRTTFKSARHRLCGWHLIEKTWEHIIGKYIGGKCNYKALEVQKIIKKWLYDMVKEVETVEEITV